MLKEILTICTAVGAATIVTIILLTLMSAFKAYRFGYKQYTNTFKQPLWERLLWNILEYSMEKGENKAKKKMQKGE